MNRRTSILAVPPFAAVVLGCAVLAARPPATFAAVAMTLMAGLAGALGGLAPTKEHKPSPGRWLVTVAVGVAAFAVARSWAVIAPLPFSVAALGANLLAGVAEELFFRRLVYGWLVRWGPAVAVSGAAVAFAAVHLPAYGVGALPVDLAAGLLFGWQRWASGGWTAPAFTHMAANLLQMR